MKTVINLSTALDGQNHLTTFVEFSDGSARVTERGPKDLAPVRPLNYKEDFSEGSEEAADCIKAAQKEGCLMLP